MLRLILTGLWTVAWLAGHPAGGAQESLLAVGVARIDVTPDYPVRLAGYAARKTESEGVLQHLYAKALALGSDTEKPALLLTVDNCGVPSEVRAALVARLRRKGIDPECVAVCSTHTHSAPWLKGYLPNLFVDPLPPDQAARLERYTGELIDALEKAALAALTDRRPARLTYARGQAGFAANRRIKKGPVDPDLPVLFVTDPATGTLRAIFTSYACHATTMTGEFNQIGSDWPGCAQAELERAHPGAVALVALGCGANANPSPRPGFELAQKHGREIAAEIERLLTNTLSAIDGPLTCRAREIRLPFDPIPTRADWQEVAHQTNAIGRHARLNLARLDRGERIPTGLPYLVQTWTFGRSLTMVFLPGEVVADYSLRLKREYAQDRLWVNAYANDVPCYIPSERILAEGGYEATGAMIYYDKPAGLAPGVEKRIISAVHALVPAIFLAREGAAK